MIYFIKEVISLKYINYESIGTVIKIYREKKGITQVELSKLIGRSESSIQKYEKGVVEIPNSVLSKISKALDVPLWVIYGIDPKGDEVENYNKMIASAINSAKESLKDKIPGKDLEQAISKVRKESVITYEEAIINKLSVLNEDGKKEALKRVNELSQLEQYREEND